MKCNQYDREFESGLYTMPRGKSKAEASQEQRNDASAGRTGRSVRPFHKKGRFYLLAVMVVVMMSFLGCGSNSGKEEKIDRSKMEQEDRLPEPTVTEAAVTEAPTPTIESVTPTATPEPSTDDGENTAAPESQESNTDSNGLRSDFKEAMDSYESFMNEYVAFMKKYAENPSDMSLLSDYTSYMSKYTDVVSKFAQWESEGLNDAELTYYLEVQTRVNAKLAEVAGY